MGLQTFGYGGVLRTSIQRLPGRIRLRYFSETVPSYPGCARKDTAPDVWLLDLNAVGKDCLFPKLDLMAAVNVLPRSPSAITY